LRGSFPCGRVSVAGTRLPPYPISARPHRAYPHAEVCDCDKRGRPRTDVADESLG
jgi:hypothetical protein